MEKISVKELIEFREKSSGKAKSNFGFKLKNRKAKEKKVSILMYVLAVLFILKYVFL